MPEARYERQVGPAEAELAGAEAEVGLLRANADRIESLIAEAEAVDAPAETLRRRAELRDAVAGRLLSPASIEALREALRGTFARVDADIDEDGTLWLFPAVRDEALAGIETTRLGTLDDGTPLYRAIEKRRPLPADVRTAGNPDPLLAR
jgi:multidrug resistance efflux pump